MKKYGTVVLLALGDALVNALVVQSVEQADGEHLVVFALDPSHEATALGGQSVDAAIKKYFVTPLTEGKTFGWKDLPEPVLPTASEPSEETGEQAAAPSMTVIQFGLGKVVSTVGKSGGFPAVVIEPASPTGEVGTDASGNAPQDVILAGAVVLEFHGDSGAGVLVEDIVKATGLKIENITEPSPNLKAAAAIIEQQSTLIKTHRQKIAELESELAAVKAELATTTEGIDKQLQGIADATAAKEAAPEATADPTSSETAPSTAQDSPSPSPDSPSSDSSPDSATSE